ncbi:MAG: hypothetical protein ACRD04_03155 [Terriglobales bacterium]
MGKNKDCLQSARDLLVLKKLVVRGAAHIDCISDALLHVEEGSLYPALHRLEQEG